ncbi:MAG: alpha-mannosidase, partial [Catenulispora sp.]|nr:alpha-mannosidase [Catenulispora sp.]
MPGSEAMARQFVHGKRFFLEEFGVENDEAWLPDTFGFAGGLPQIIKAAGSKWLLTQKISWSQINKFPHHTFLWEGIDGTRIFTHFPPVDTYNCSMKGSEIAHAARNFKDKGRASVSLAPTGWGDGGGGTTREMIAKAKRLKDLEGSARVEWEKPADFFAKAEAEYQNPPVWVGELYLELHRATLTSQAGTKQGNRRSEQLLRTAELWAATAAVRTGYEYPYERLDHLWKTVLLHQFHDILPGSSIAWVHREAEATYRTVGSALIEGVISPAQGALRAGTGGGEAELDFNSSPYERRGIPAGGAGAMVPPEDGFRVSPRADGGHVLENDLVRVEIDGRGLVVSLFDVEQGRETLPPGSAANLLQIHPDFPNMWDAWDVDEFYRNTVTDLTEADEISLDDSLPGTATVVVSRSFGASKVHQMVSIRPGTKVVEFHTEVDWHETEKFLKLAFPMDIHAERYASETQFGHIYRPTHTNTSWDAAKFETCNHGFLHFEEPGWGVAVLSGSTYGHDVTRTVRQDGGTTVTARVSLLRAPRFPDPETDQGVHRFTHAVVPGAAIGDAVREGRILNTAEAGLGGGPADGSVVEPLFTIDDDAVTASAIKLADDRSGDVVLRVYESHGGRASALVTPGFDVSGFEICDLLERPISREGVSVTAEGAGVRLKLRPFQLVTLRFTRSTGSSEA